MNSSNECASAATVAPSQAAERGPRSRRWLLFALLSLTVWGVSGFLSKLGATNFSPGSMQVLFTLGALPLFLHAWLRSRRTPWGKKSGVALGMLTGMITAFGNGATFAAMRHGKASVVAPTVALFPIVTFALALLLLQERVNRVQCGGVLLALAAFVLLSQ